MRDIDGYGICYLCSTPGVRHGVSLHLHLKRRWKLVKNRTYIVSKLPLPTCSPSEETVMKFIALFLVAFLHRVSADSSAHDPGLTVPTAQGSVSGTLVLPSVRQFLGIPYATAKRWQAPQLPPVRKGTFKATSFGDSCPQDLNAGAVEFLILANAGGLNVSSSENCFSVNIWAPSTNRKQKTAVMIWIYGGGFTFGTTNIPAYIGQNFVRDNDDLTIVTINYRTNIFGQPNAPQLANPKKAQNFGMLDIDAAIQWVHANIAHFGGDPNRIVIFGQSAGSAAVDAYSFAHPHDTIVKGLIEQSGTLSGGSTNALAGPADGNIAWNTVSSAVGCGNATTPKQLTCMEAVPFKTLEDAVIKTNVDFNLVNDNITIFADTAQRAADGNFLRVPMLGGSVANEEDIFIVAQELLTLGFTIPVVTEMLSDVTTLLAFTCPAGATAMHRVTANVPTFRYLYQGVFPDMSTREDLRAYHASEISMVFGTYNGTAIPATPTQIALSRYVQSAWVAFARNPAKGLVDFGWPLYNPNTTSLAQLGNFANQTGVVFTKGNLVDAACSKKSVLLQIQSQLAGLLTV